MKTEIGNSLGRISAQIDHLGGIMSKAFADTRAGARSIQKSCVCVQTSQQQFINLLKGMNNE